MADLPDPADLITDDDLDSINEMVSAGAGLDVALYEHAPQWRARWVAEALEQFRVELGQVPAQNLLPGLLHARDRARELAAEYRDGWR